MGITYSHYYFACTFTPDIFDAISFNFTHMFCHWPCRKSDMYIENVGPMYIVAEGGTNFYPSQV